MKYGLFSPALLAAAALILSGCNSGSSTPVVTATPVLSNLSGDYSGTVDDSQAGNGTATATFAQTGADVGGQLTEVESSGTITGQMSFTIDAANATAGSMVIDYSSGTTCSFHTSGSFNASTGVLSGTYTAVTNCSGQTGSYSLTQQCTDTVTSVVRREKTGIAPC